MVSSFLISSQAYPYIVCPQCPILSHPTPRCPIILHLPMFSLQVGNILSTHTGIGVARTFRLGGKLFSAKFEEKFLLSRRNLEWQEKVKIKDLNSICKENIGSGEFLEWSKDFFERDGRMAVGRHFPKWEGLWWDKTLPSCTLNSKTAHEALLVHGIRTKLAPAAAFSFWCKTCFWVVPCFESQIKLNTH